MSNAITEYVPTVDDMLHFVKKALMQLQSGDPSVAVKTLKQAELVGDAAIIYHEKRLPSHE